jgi:hypothetical protein
LPYARFENCFTKILTKIPLPFGSVRRHPSFQAIDKMRKRIRAIEAFAPEEFLRDYSDAPLRSASPLRSRLPQQGSGLG